MTVTPDELRALADGAVTKYRSRSVWVQELGRRFSSQHEAEVAVGLVRRQQAGEIRDLRFQVPYDLSVEGQRVCRYVADFAFEERYGEPTPPFTGHQLPGFTLYRWRFVVADAKGFPTPVWKIKKKLMRAIYAIEVLEL